MKHITYLEFFCRKPSRNGFKRARLAPARLVVHHRVLTTEIRPQFGQPVIMRPFVNTITLILSLAYLTPCVLGTGPYEVSVSERA